MMTLVLVIFSPLESHSSMLLEILYPKIFSTNVFFGIINKRPKNFVRIALTHKTLRTMFNSSRGEGESSIRFDLAFFTCRVLLQLRFSTKNKKNEKIEKI